MPVHKQIQSLRQWITPILFFCMATIGYGQEPESRTAVAGASSQSLSLFESVETAEKRGGSSNRPARESRVTTAEPEFTLVGVSRVGAKYSAILRHKAGEDFIVKAEPSATTQIPEHSGYAIVDITASSVSIRYPGNNACVDFVERGVSCSSAANIAQLVLANGEPLVVRNPTVSDKAEDESSTENEEVSEAQTNRTNPFEAFRNRRRGEGSNAGSNTIRNEGARFAPRRIDPADVPEGKRIVATPFGDRLVDQ